MQALTNPNGILNYGNASYRVIADTNHDSRQQKLELGLVLRLLQDRLHLGCLHHISFDLEFTAHEQLLCVGFSGNELREVVV